MCTKRTCGKNIERKIEIPLFMCKYHCCKPCSAVINSRQLKKKTEDFKSIKIVVDIKKECTLKT